MPIHGHREVLQRRMQLLRGVGPVDHAVRAEEDGVSMGIGEPLVIGGGGIGNGQVYVRAPRLGDDCSAG